MSSRPPGWPMRSSRSPTAAWTTCGRRTVEVSQACRHVAGGEAAEPVCTCRPSRRFRLHLRFDVCMEMGCLHAQPERRLLAPSMERGKVHSEETPWKRPSGENHDGKLGTLARSYRQSALFFVWSRSSLLFERAPCHGGSGMESFIGNELGWSCSFPCFVAIAWELASGCVLYV